MRCSGSTFSDNSGIFPISGPTQFPTPFETVSVTSTPSPFAKTEDNGGLSFIVPVAIGIAIFAFLTLSALSVKFKVMGKMFGHEERISIQVMSKNPNFDSKRTTTLSGLPLGESTRMTSIICPRPESVDTWYTISSDNKAQIKLDCNSTVAADGTSKD